MKVNINNKIEGSNLEILDIQIEFDPTKSQEEGYAALIMTMVDVIRHTLALERAVDAIETE